MNNTKHILISAYSCDPKSGTEPGYGWNWPLTLALKGYSVTCLASDKKQANILEALREHKLPNLKFEFVSLGVYNNWYKIPFLGNYLHYYLWQRKAYSVAKKLDALNPIDLIHHVTWGSLQQGSSLWKLKKKMIFGPVGGGQHAPKAFKKYFENKWYQEILRSWISKLFIKWNSNCYKTLQSADRILVSNTDTLLLAKTLGNDNVFFLPDTCVPEDFIPISLPNRSFGKKLKILWLGRLLPRKGLSLVLESLSKVDSAVDYELTIVGDGPMAKYLPNWINKFKLNNKVNWVGKVPYDRVKQYYSESDLFVFCSLRDSCGVQLIEAMAYALPIITLNIHGSGSIVPDGAGIKIPVTNPNETSINIAKAIENYYFHPETLKLNGIKGYFEAQNHTFAKKVEQCINTHYIDLL